MKQIALSSATSSIPESAWRALEDWQNLPNQLTESELLDLDWSETDYTFDPSLHIYKSNWTVLYVNFKGISYGVPHELVILNRERYEENSRIIVRYRIKVPMKYGDGYFIGIVKRSEEGSYTLETKNQQGEFEEICQIRLAA